MRNYKGVGLLGTLLSIVCQLVLLGLLSFYYYPHKVSLVVCVTKCRFIRLIKEEAAYLKTSFEIEYHIYKINTAINQVDLNTIETITIHIMVLE